MTSFRRGGKRSTYQVANEDAAEEVVEPDSAEQRRAVREQLARNPDLARRLARATARR